ncbi:unnamed protein product [Calypogeia fissa]
MCGHSFVQHRCFFVSNLGKVVVQFNPLGQIETSCPTKRLGMAERRDHSKVSAGLLHLGAPLKKEGCLDRLKFGASFEFEMRITSWAGD